MRWVILAIVLVSVEALALPPSVEVKQVAALDPVAEAEVELARPVPRFLKIRGVAEDVPGVGRLTYKVCFRQSAEAIAVQGFTDAPRSDSAAEMMTRAHRTAEEYNALVAERLQERGASLCAPGANWDAAIGSVARSLEKHRLAYPTVTVNEGVPTLILEIGERNAAETVQSICRILSDFKAVPAKLEILGGNEPEAATPYLCNSE